jgi:hypothetical protein
VDFSSRCGSLRSYAPRSLPAARSRRFRPLPPSTGKRQAPVERDFRLSDVAKSDIDVAAK